MVTHRRKIENIMDQNQKPYRASDEGGKTPGKPRPDRRDLLRRGLGGRPSQGGSKGGPGGWSFGHRIAFFFLLVLLGVFLWKQMHSPSANYSPVSYTQFDEMLNTGRLDHIVIGEGSLRAKLKLKAKVNPKDTRLSDGIVTQIGNYDQAFVKDLAAKGIDVRIEPEKIWIKILDGALFYVFVLVAFFFFLRLMQGGTKGVFTFGKSKARLIAENSQKVTFADVAGVNEAKEELQEIIEFLKEPRKFQRLGGKIPKGALLVGPPGTGKTLLARAVAGEAGVPFFSMSGSDFVEMFVGVGASRVRDLFEQGKNNAPCIIFIDEIDAVGRQRGTGIGGGHDEREQTLNQLLVEMDGFETNDGVILIAATNRPDVLDPALLRPGRFDRQIVVDWPDVKSRADILKVHAREIQLDQNVDLDRVAKGTPGMTGADLANVVNEAALLAARLNRKRVTSADFEEAKDKVMMGAARKTLVITEEEKKLTAYHEAGHVLVSKFIPGSDPVHKVSIVARGRALGLTHFLPQDERHNWSNNYCMDKMAVLLGGRAAEIVKFDDVTNGAANDIERATALARKMVCEWGMSKRLGPLAFGRKETEVFLGRDITTHKDYSEQTAVAIDQEIRKYVETAQQRAESIILEHTDKLEILTAEILKHEVLSGDEIDSILNGKFTGRKRSGRRGGRRSGGPRENRDAATPAAEPLHETREDHEAAASKEPAPVRENVTIKEPPAVREINSKGALSAVEGLGDGASDGVEGTTGAASRSSRRRRGTRSRKRTPEGTPDRTVEQGAAADVAAPAVADGGKPSGGKESGTSGGERKSDSSEPKDKNDKSDSGSGEGKSVFRTRRTRMVNLKTGGRRRVIRKAPAQKIREIN